MDRNDVNELNVRITHLIERGKLLQTHLERTMDALEISLAVNMIHDALRTWGATPDQALLYRLQKLTERNNRLALESRTIVDAIRLSDWKMASGPIGG